MTERLAYDPWGKRRNINGNTDTTDSITGQMLRRGYTQHEHLDEVGVIHMNGRVYDPLVGRMMSAAPYIQAPGNLQSYNRYAYVMNNPLAMTDPSGYIGEFSWRSFTREVINAGVSTTGFMNVGPVGGYVANKAVTGPNGYLVASLGMAASCQAVGGGPICVGVGQALVAFAFGATPQEAARAGAVAGLTAWGFELAGDGAANGTYGKYSAAHYGAHATVGCVSSVANGGRCGSGAASAMVGLGATEWTSSGGSYWNIYTRGAVVTVAGGAASVISGGSFANGAVTAAYGYLFNELGNHVLENPESIDGKSFPNAKGNTECVEVAKQCLAAPPTSRWVQGERVVGNDGIEKGTVIATFVDGKYTGHTAIYLSQDSNGNMKVLDQWNSRGRVGERTIWNNPRKSFVDNASNYSVVKW